MAGSRLFSPMSASLDLFSGDGEVAALLRTHDWSAFPEGVPSRWPASLKTLVALVLDSTLPMRLTWGSDLRLLYNDAYAGLIGRKHPDALGRPYWDVWPELQSQLGQAMDQALAGSASFADVAIRLRRHEHEERAWFSISFSPVRDDNGGIAGVLTTAVEITGQVLLERRQAFNLKFADVVRSREEPAAIASAATAMLGTELGVARVFYAEVAEDDASFGVGHEWTRPGVKPAIGDAGVELLRLDDFGPELIAALRAGIVCATDDVRTDPRTAAHAEAFIETGGVYANLAIPYVKSGRLVAILTLHRLEPYHWTETDIQLSQEMAERTWSAVESARAQTALRISEAHLTALFAQSAAAIAETDLEGRIIHVNDRYCELLGRDRAQLLGMGMHDFTHPDDLVWNAPMLDALVASGRPFEVEKRYVRPDGSVVWGKVIVSLIRPGPGVPPTVLAVFVDITERKRYEEKLREADRLKDEFLAMLAHELRNPLAPISAAAELIAGGALDAGRVSQTSEVIVRQARHMTDLMEDLLDVSRVTRGLVVLDSAPVDIGTIAADAVEQVRPLVETRGHRLAVGLPPEAAWVSGDAKRLVQVLVNLLGNAAKFTPNGGRIALDVQTADDRVVLTVRDNGIGMLPELQERAFELFAQAERTADRSQGGLGIGLALVKSLVQLHGGTVRAASDGPGRGAVFTVTLPRLVRELAPGQAGGPAVPASSDCRPLRILVVDDNVDAAQVLALLLEMNGHEVAVEYTSGAALARAVELRPDVCLLDIGLPDMDGNALAAQLRTLPGMADAILVAVTGYGQPHDLCNSRAAGFDHHFVKPVDTQRLLELLAGAAERRYPNAARRL
ncbi:PAS domain S-box protein [Oxalobacteraceae bacterium OM1]|nr:PAS domain S-box protein [Oxalobacteraceae bacterium OM1]